MIEVNFSPLRLMTIAMSLLIVFFLEFFTNVDQRTVISIALILIFLVIFTFIFVIMGSPNLKVGIILFIFLVLPSFVLQYCGFYASLPGLLDIVITGIITIILGILSLITIVEISYLEIDYDGED